MPSYTSPEKDEIGDRTDFAVTPKRPTEVQLYPGAELIGPISIPEGVTLVVVERDYSSRPQIPA